MKSLGVEILISFSAVGSLKEELVPGTLVLVEQLSRNQQVVGSSPIFGTIY